VIDSHLPQALEELLVQPAERRGREAEEFARLIFRRAHFAVRDHPGAGRPRRSDLFASTERRHYLVEVKATRRKADAETLSGLRDRLRRCPPDVVGVLISLSGFTKTIAQEIVAERSRPVLLLGRPELFAVVDGTEDLRALLERKLASLTADGRVLLDQDEPHGSLVRQAVGERQPCLVSLDGEPLPWVAGSGSFGNYTFVLSLNDPTLGPGPETSAALNLRCV
jgi:Restriction endonuclease